MSYHNARWFDVVSHPVPLFGLHYPDPEGMNYLLNNFEKRTTIYSIS